MTCFRLIVRWTCCVVVLSSIGCKGGGSDNADASGLSDARVDSARIDAGPVDAGPLYIPFTDVKLISAGGRHVCAIRNDDMIWCWGNSRHGQLGTGVRGDWSAAARAATTHQASDVQAGGWHTCASWKEGGYSCWGYNGVGQLGMSPQFQATPPEPISSGPYRLELGTQTTCYYHPADVVCFGDNSAGQMGRGTESSSPAAPGSVQGGTRVLFLASGEFHMCGAQNTGTVICWGANESGQLGTGDRFKRLTAAQTINITNASKIVVGNSHSCALLSDNTISCWGDNLSSQIGPTAGSSTVTPTAIEGLSNVAQITAGATHTCALRSDATVACWGSNSSGQLGDGTVENRPTPVAVANLSNVAEISAGWDFTCARKQDNTVWCWGRNDVGQLGTGDTTASAVPVQVMTHR